MTLTLYHQRTRRRAAGLPTETDLEGRVGCLAGLGGHVGLNMSQNCFCPEGA